MLEANRGDAARKESAVSPSPGSQAGLRVRGAAYTYGVLWMNGAHRGEEVEGRKGVGVEDKEGPLQG